MSASWAPCSEAGNPSCLEGNSRGDVSVRVLKRNKQYLNGLYIRLAYMMWSRWPKGYLHNLGSKAHASTVTSGPKDTKASQGASGLQSTEVQRIFEIAAKREWLQ